MINLDRNMEFYMAALSIMLITLLIVAEVNAAEHFTIKEIAELPTGEAHVLRSANDIGNIVGTIKRSSRDKGGYSGAIWGDNGKKRDIEPKKNSDYSTALGINDDDQVVGSVNTETGIRAFRTLADGTSVLLDLIADDNSNAAIAVNKSGDVAGWSSGPSGISAVIWDANGKVKGLKSLSGSDSCKALIINVSKDVAGTCDLKSGSQAVLWRSDALDDDPLELGALPGDSWSFPAGINKKGDIVGTSGDGERNTAVLWERDGKGIKSLGVLSGNKSSRALGINNDGDIVGYAEGGDSREHAFIWTKKSGMKDLNELLPVNSGFFIAQAIAINSKGNISALGYEQIANPNNHLHDEQIPMRIFQLKNVNAPLK